MHEINEFSEFHIKPMSSSSNRSEYPKIRRILEKPH